MKTESPSTRALQIWVIYAHPQEHPDHYVARLWLNDVVTPTSLHSDDLTTVRQILEDLGLVRTMPSAEDDAAILEVWV